MGKIEVSIIESPIQIDKIYQSISAPSFGASVVFLGVVRDHNDGKRVQAVSYDVFEPLAKKSFQEISDEAQAKWGKDLNIILIHRKGKLQVGEVSVAIGVGSPHREEAYEASRYVIEQLKERSPIWKKEFYEDGETEWLRGHALCHRGHSGGGAIQADGPR